MNALRAHPFFAPINWSTLWTDPAPPLETGLVRREVPQPGHGDWDDVGQAWDDLVGGESSDDASTPGQHGDGLAWAPDAQGAEYALFGKSRVAYEVGYVPPEDVGPRGELPDYARERLEKPTEAPPTPAVVSSPGMGGPSTPMDDHTITTVVQGNGDIQFKLPGRNSEQTPRSSNTTVVPIVQPSSDGNGEGNGSSAVDTESISTVSAGTGTDGSPDRESAVGNGVGIAPVDMPVPRSRRDTYATSSSDGSPIDKPGPFDTMRRRGRNRTRSPVGGSGNHSEPRPPLEPDWYASCVIYSCSCAHYANEQVIRPRTWRDYSTDGRGRGDGDEAADFAAAFAYPGYTQAAEGATARA